MVALNSIRWWVAISIFIAPIVGASADSGTLTVFYLVRHAEKSAGADPSLTADGVQRAVDLQSILRNAPIAAIYTTATSRTQETVAPIAQDSQLVPIEYPPQSGEPTSVWADRLVHQHEGQHVLIVGHSGAANQLYTVASIVAALSDEPVAAITGDEYDNLYVVTIHRPESGPETRELTRNRYGALESVKNLVVATNDQPIVESLDISAVVKDGDHLVIAADEGDSIQVLRPGDDDAYVPQAPLSLGNEDELDIEGLARGDDHTYYVLGSHSRRRKPVGPFDAKTWERKYSKNQERMLAEEIKSEKSRARLYRFTFDPTNGVSDWPPDDQDDIRLRDVFEEHDVLKAFVELPSKENGIDIEGVAVDGDLIYLGFRGPVLRNGFVPIVRLRFDEQQDNEVLYVNLDGRGIRDMVKVEDGFLIIGGPLGDSNLSYLLYHWNGHDTLPGVREAGEPPRGTTTLLGRIPTPAGAKAEGIAVLDENTDHYQVIIAYDSVDDGGMWVLRTPRP